MAEEEEIQWDEVSTIKRPRGPMTAYQRKQFERAKMKPSKEQIDFSLDLLEIGAEMKAKRKAAERKDSDNG